MRDTSVPLGVLAPLLVFATGMALFTAPLAAIALGALDDPEQGLAAGVNHVMGQLAGLLAVAVLPALAGMAGSSTFAGPVVAAAYPRAPYATALVALCAIPIALWTFRQLPDEVAT